MFVLRLSIRQKPKLLSLCVGKFGDEFFQLFQHVVLPRLAAPATTDAVLADDLPLFNAEVERVVNRAVVVQNIIAAEVGRVTVLAVSIGIRYHRGTQGLVIILCFPYLGFLTQNLG